MRGRDAAARRSRAGDMLNLVGLGQHADGALVTGDFGEPRLQLLRRQVDPAGSGRLFLDGDGLLDFLQRRDQGLTIALLEPQRVTGRQRQRGFDAPHQDAKLGEGQAVIAVSGRLSGLHLFQRWQRESQGRVMEARVPPA